MQLKEYTKKIHKHATIIERLWWTLNKSFNVCQIPASETRLFGSAVIVFEYCIIDLKEFAASPETITSNKEEMVNAVFDTVISAATIFKYISDTLSRKQGLPMALLAAKAIQEELFSMMEDCQNFIMEE